MDRDARCPECGTAADEVDTAARRASRRLAWTAAGVVLLVNIVAGVLGREATSARMFTVDEPDRFVMPPISVTDLRGPGTPPDLVERIVELAPATWHGRDGHLQVTLHLAPPAGKRWEVTDYGWPVPILRVERTQRSFDALTGVQGDSRERRNAPGRVAPLTHSGSSWRWWGGALVHGPTPAGAEGTDRMLSFYPAAGAVLLALLAASWSAVMGVGRVIAWRRARMGRPAPGRRVVRRAAACATGAVAIALAAGAIVGGAEVRANPLSQRSGVVTGGDDEVLTLGRLRALDDAGLARVLADGAADGTYLAVGYEHGPHDDGLADQAQYGWPLPWLRVTTITELTGGSPDPVAPTTRVRFEAGGLVLERRTPGPPARLFSASFEIVGVAVVLMEVWLAWYLVHGASRAVQLRRATRRRRTGRCPACGYLLAPVVPVG